MLPDEAVYPNARPRRPVKKWATRPDSPNKWGHVPEIPVAIGLN